MTSPAARTGVAAGGCSTTYWRSCSIGGPPPRCPGTASSFLPPVHADLRPVQAGGPPIWIGGTSEAAMRRVGRIGTGWLGVEGLQDFDRLWSIARSAADDAGRDPDALKTAMRINLEPGTSADAVVDRVQRLAESGADEAMVDAFAVFPARGTARLRQPRGHRMERAREGVTASHLWPSAASFICRHVATPWATVDARRGSGE